MSQLDLAVTAGVSSRHVSFLETGRSRPSRAMVLRLAATLELPLRERNALLVAAGFAPLYRESDLASVDLAPIRRAVELVLASHEPFPAFVLDRAWNVVLANRAHERMLPALLPEGTAAPDPVNIVQLVLDPALVRPRIANWKLVAHVLGHRVRQRLRAPLVDAHIRERFERWLSYPGVQEAMNELQAPPDAAVVIPLELELAGTRLSWFSTIATIGTPQDVTIDELCIESMFPADERTERFARNLAAG